MDQTQQVSPDVQRQFPCRNCGASLVFAPGSDALTCPYCGTVNEIPKSDERVEELPFEHMLAELPAEQFADVVTVRCGTCGAETTFDPNVTAKKCPFCGSGIVAQGLSKRVLKPRSLLPFAITHAHASRHFNDWLGGLWFAPNDLFKQARQQDILGVYIPAWTYDTDATTRYTGQRGEDYWTTETYTTVENGRRVTRTRQVRRTRWYPAAGTVFNRFDDVLVLASHSLPPKLAHNLEPWDLKSLVPYQDEYLSGFQAESYQVDLPNGFEVAKELMVPTIQMTIRRDIGGDHQQIHSMASHYDHTTFKHVLLPIWISAYRYHEKTYRFLVNARTGEVQGERPYSAIKIMLAVLAALIVAAVVFWFMQGQQF